MSGAAPPATGLGAWGSRERLDAFRRTRDLALREVPYYRERAGQWDRPIERFEDLADLPIVDQEAFADDPASFCARQEWPHLASFSSATTRPIGRVRWHAARELELLLDAAPRDRRDGIVLDIHPFDRSPPLAPPGARRVSVPFLVPWHREYILELLRDGWRGPEGPLRIEAILAFSPALRLLTVWLERRGIDPASFGVELLAGYGSIQPACWRRRLERVWGARYRDHYGLSELQASGSSDCPACGAFHFGGPLVAEVVDPSTRRPLDAGAGLLVLSELHPWAQLQILLRYSSDDLVEIAPPCLMSPFGVSLRGRIGESVVLPGEAGRPSLAVGALQVAELAAGVPEVAVAEIPWSPEEGEVGAPRVGLTSDAGTVRVEVELRFQPDLFPEAARQVGDRLRERLLRAVTGLRTAVDSGRVGLEVATLERGALARAVRV